ncbi:MAG: hypothetical protein HC888_02225 [Candidatus Competibacteraceae bacterium]|nr:hypothetical protein [Candidatus Competibacteraceae bacterium]
MNQACGDTTSNRLRLGSPDAVMTSSQLLYASSSINGNSGVIRVDPTFLGCGSSSTAVYRSDIIVGPCSVSPGAFTFGTRITTSIDSAISGSPMSLVAHGSLINVNGGSAVSMTVYGHYNNPRASGNYNIAAIYGHQSTYFLSNASAVIPLIIGYSSGGNTGGAQASITNFYGFDSSVTGTITGTAAQYRYTHPVSGAVRYGIWGNTDLAGCAAGWATGTSGDTCQFRGRANAWTFLSGGDLYTGAGGAFCAGTGCTSSAPVDGSEGIYDSNIRVVRSCTAGSGISCSVTAGVLSVSDRCSGVPTIALGAGAGTGATISILGSDCAFLVQLTTGTGASVGTDYTVTFQNAFVCLGGLGSPACVSMPKNQVTNALLSTANKMPFINSGGLTSIQVANVGVALSDSVAYAWNWICSC